MNNEDNDDENIPPLYRYSRLITPPPYLRYGSHRNRSTSFSSPAQRSSYLSSNSHSYTIRPETRIKNQTLELQDKIKQICSEKIVSEGISVSDSILNIANDLMKKSLDIYGATIKKEEDDKTSSNDNQSNQFADEAEDNNASLKKEVSDITSSNNNLPVETTEEKTRLALLLEAMELVVFIQDHTIKLLKIKPSKELATFLKLSQDFSSELFSYYEDYLNHSDSNLSSQLPIAKLEKSHSG